MTNLCPLHWSVQRAASYRGASESSLKSCRPQNGGMISGTVHKTGAIVADLLARTDSESYVLVEHSLGARAMMFATQTLGTKRGAPKIQAAHFLGAAVGANRDCHALSATVEDAIYNYHSSNDSVLKYAYSIVEAGKEAAGRVDFISGTHKGQNIDVLTLVQEHSDYLKTVSLR